MVCDSFAPSQYRFMTYTYVIKWKQLENVMIPSIHAIFYILQNTT